MIDGQKIAEWFPTLAKAKAAKKFRNANLKKYGKISTEFKEKDWAELKAARDLLPTGTSLIEAVKYYTERHSAGNHLTLEQCVNVFMASQKKRKNSLRHYQNCQSHLNKLLEYIDVPLAKDVTRQQLADAFDLLSETLSPRSVLNHRGTWAQFFKYLVTTQKLVESPMASITPEHRPNNNAGNEKNTRTRSSRSDVGISRTRFSQTRLLVSDPVLCRIPICGGKSIPA